VKSKDRFARRASGRPNNNSLDGPARDDRQMAVTFSNETPKHALLSPLRHRDFRLFWTGLLLSSIGSQFTTVAMAWQIYELTNSPLHIGFIGIVRAAPQIVMLLFGGLLADAVNRRKLIMYNQSGLFVVSATLALLTFFGQTTPLTLYLVTMCLALLSSLEMPARHSIVANLVPRPELAKASALYSSQRYVAVIAGPALAGIVLSFVGPAVCYFIDALSWLVMFLTLLRMQTRFTDGGGPRIVSLSSLRAGWAFVLGHTVIFPLLIVDFGANIFGSVRALLPIYARDILVVGPEGLGFLYAAAAVGSLVGAVGLSMLGEVRRAGLWILVGIAIYGSCIVLFARSQSFWFSVLLLVGSGIGDTISAVLRATINQLGTPDELRGRMSSINSIFTNSGPQLGQFEAGVLAALIGAELSVMTGGIMILSIVAITAFAFPHVRQFEIKDRSAKNAQA
jgi:MFS family permease